MWQYRRGAFTHGILPPRENRLLPFFARFEGTSRGCLTEKSRILGPNRHSGSEGHLWGCDREVTLFVYIEACISERLFKTIRLQPVLNYAFRTMISHSVDLPSHTISRDR